MGNLIIEGVPESIIKTIGTKISYKNFNSSIFTKNRRKNSNIDDFELKEIGIDDLSNKSQERLKNINNLKFTNY